MIRHVFNCLVDFNTHATQRDVETVQRHPIGAAIVVPGHNMLSEIDREPARLEKQSARVRLDSAARPKQSDLRGEAVWNGHRTHIVPKRRIAPARRVVVQDQEVADPIVFNGDEVVELIAIDVRDFFVREQLEQRGDGYLDEIDAGRLERLEKPAR